MLPNYDKGIRILQFRVYAIPNIEAARRQKKVFTSLQGPWGRNVRFDAKPAPHLH